MFLSCIINLASALPNKYCKAGEVGLVFVEGPSEQTATILETLKEKKVQATFVFATNSISETNKPLIKQAADDGHPIGLRANPDRNYEELTNETEISKDFDISINMLQEITGQDIKFTTVPLVNNQVQMPIFNYLASKNIIEVGYMFNPADTGKSPSEAVADFLKSKNKRYDAPIIFVYEQSVKDQDELKALITEIQKNWKIATLDKCLKDVKPGELGAGATSGSDSSGVDSVLSGAIMQIFAYFAL